MLLVFIVVVRIFGCIDKKSNELVWFGCWSEEEGRCEWRKWNLEGKEGVGFLFSVLCFCFKISMSFIWKSLGFSYFYIKGHFNYLILLYGVETETMNKT